MILEDDPEKQGLRSQMKIVQIKLTKF